MKFFVDSNLQEIESGVEVLNENQQSDGTPMRRHYIKGPFIEVDTPNGNGRVYPQQNVSKEIDRFIREDIAQDRAVGECDHPAKPEVNLEKIAIKIDELQQEGKQYLGKAKVLNTPMGKLIQTFIEEDLRIGVSTRALGSLRESRSGYKEVQDDFKLIAIDAVHGPSAPNAFVEGIMENTEYFIENGIVQSEEELARIQREANKAAKKKKELQEQAYQVLFEKWLNKKF